MILPLRPRIRKFIIIIIIIIIIIFKTNIKKIYTHRHARTILLEMFQEYRFRSP